MDVNSADVHRQSKRAAAVVGAVAFQRLHLADLAAVSFGSI